MDLCETEFKLKLLEPVSEILSDLHETQVQTYVMWASLWDPAFEEELFEVSLRGVWVDDKGWQGGVDAGPDDWVDVLVDESQHHTALS